MTVFSVFAKEAKYSVCPVKPGLTLLMTPLWIGPVTNASHFSLKQKSVALSKVLRTYWALSIFKTPTFTGPPSLMG